MSLQLIFAIKANKPLIANSLITEELDLDILYDDKTALMFASEKNQKDVVETLIQYGADINLVNQNQKTALMSAAFAEKSPIVKLLLERGANVEAKDSNGRTVLMQAVMRNSIKITMMLLDHAANINARDNHNNTALTLAVEGSYASKDVVKLLLQFGANLEAKDRNGKTALMKAALADKDQSVVKFLLESGADIDAIDSHGNTVLMNAVRSDNHLTVRYLIEYYKYSKSCYSTRPFSNLYTPITESDANIAAYINIPNNKGTTALMEAIYFANIDVIKSLLLNGADVNARDDSGMTALMQYMDYMSWRSQLSDEWLSYNNALLDQKDKEIIGLLLDYGTNIYLENNRGETVITMAPNLYSVTVNNLLNKYISDEPSSKRRKPS